MFVIGIGKIVKRKEILREEKLITTNLRYANSI